MQRLAQVCLKTISDATSSRCRSIDCGGSSPQARCANLRGRVANPGRPVRLPLEASGGAPTSRSLSVSSLRFEDLSLDFHASLASANFKGTGRRAVASTPRADRRASRARPVRNWHAMSPRGAGGIARLSVATTELARQLGPTSLTLWKIDRKWCRTRQVVLTHDRQDRRRAFPGPPPLRNALFHDILIRWIFSFYDNELDRFSAVLIEMFHGNPGPQRLFLPASR
ncbi:hypothetical protein SAMN05444680_109105 [Variovorax sp. YR216]|nr:hypothetical protein SAMN05444680_109105 [Variovorax sp. YR216]